MNLATNRQTKLFVSVRSLTSDLFNRFDWLYEGNKIVAIHDTTPPKISFIVKKNGEEKQETKTVTPKTMLKNFI